MKTKRGIGSYRIRLVFAVGICIGLGSTLGCKKSSKKVTPVCDGTNATYTSTVKAIVDGNCLNCHSTFSTYSGLSSVLTNGKFKQHIITDQDMPKGGSLSVDQLNKIQCWVEAGYPN